MKKTILLMWILTLGIAPLSLAIDGPWTKKTDMQTARMYLSTSVVNGKIYAIGGASRVEVGISTVEEYDPSTDTWTAKSPMPTPRWGFATGTVDGKIYAIGGAEGHPGSPSKAVEEYDPDTDTWNTKSPMPTARWGLSASVVNGKIYAIGGGIPSGYRVVEEYDPATDTWTSKASMTIGRYALSTSVVNRKIYAIGGVTFYPSTTSRVEEYDPEIDKWSSLTKVASMPTARTFFSTSVVNGKIYAIGGSYNPDRGPVSVVYQYDPEKDIWTTKEDMVIARMVLSTSVVNGKIYAIGGSTKAMIWNASATVEEYNPNPLIVDFNRDGIVDCLDMCMMVEYWYTEESLYDIAPLPSGDGVVDVQDLIVLAEHLFEESFPPGLLAYWKLDETEGATAHDSIEGNDGFGPPDLLWRPEDGKVGGALELDGIDDSIITTFSLNPVQTTFSAFAWIKGGGPEQVALSQNDGVDWLLADSEGQLMTALRRGSSGQTLTSEYVITDGDWHHIGVVWDKSHRHLYADGVEVAEDPNNLGFLSSSNGNLCIGCGNSFDSNSFFSGLIDDVRIYNQALSAEEIAALAQ